jgi:hypothetical protein
MSWLERYRAGDRDGVWHELRQLGARVRDPEVIEDASAVCDEMARRARQNIETLIDRLSAQGYRFHANDDAQPAVAPLLDPTPDAPALAQWLGQQCGALPLTVDSWVRIVGDVWLVGTHPQWPESAEADPLVIEVEGARFPDSPIRSYYTDEWTAWQGADANETERSGFVLPVAPDRLHKANISGGAPYGFRLPDQCADALFVAEVATPFVAYLNHVFANGGFPGRTLGDAQRRLKSELAEDLLLL